MRSSCVPLLQCESELIPGRIPVAFEWVFTPPDSINQSIHLYLDLCVCDHIMKTYYIHNVFPCNSGPFSTEFTRAARDGLEGVHTPPPHRSQGHCTDSNEPRAHETRSSHHRAFPLLIHCFDSSLQFPSQSCRVVTVPRNGLVSWMLWSLNFVSLSLRGTFKTFKFRNEVRPHSISP